MKRVATQVNFFQKFLDLYAIFMYFLYRKLEIPKTQYWGIPGFLSAKMLKYRKISCQNKAMVTETALNQKKKSR